MVYFSFFHFQKCVKQLCVYHPRLQALKLSNRSKLTYDEQHIAQETLSHLACAPEGAIHLECEVSPMSREHLEETESIEEIEQIDETDGVTEGEDSNAMSQVNYHRKRYFRSDIYIGNNHNLMAVQFL